MKTLRSNLYYFIRLIDQKKKLEAFERVAVALLLKKVRAFTKRRSLLSKRATLSELNKLVKVLERNVAKATAKVGHYAYKDTNEFVSYGNLLTEYKKVSMSEKQLLALAKTATIANSRLESWIGNAIISPQLLKDMNELKEKGVGYKKAVRELVKTHLNHHTTKADIETVAISYMQSVSAKAHKDIFKANKNVLKGYEWSAIMENGNVETGRGTCPRCSALDGSFSSELDSLPTCPLHPRCRCIIRPVPLSWHELLGISKDEEENIKDETNKLLKKHGFKPTGEHWAYNRVHKRRGDKQKSLVTEKGGYRSIKNKERLGLNESYADWWKSKGKRWQNNAIGRTRANLVREGDVSFKKLVDKEGNLIPLDELKVTQKALLQARRRRT